MIMKQSALHLKHADEVPQPSKKRDPNDSPAKRAALAAEAAAQDSVAKAKKSGGVVSFVGKAWKALTTKPDHSEVGFHNAIRVAIAHCEDVDYVSADHMCEEIEAEMCRALNAPGGVYCEFIGTHKKDRAPRLLIVTQWGLRHAVKGLISFSMVHAPERRRER